MTSFSLTVKIGIINIHKFLFVISNNLKEIHNTKKFKWRTFVYFIPLQYSVDVNYLEINI